MNIGLIDRFDMINRYGEKNRYAPAGEMRVYPCSFPPSLFLSAKYLQQNEKRIYCLLVEVINGETIVLKLCRQPVGLKFIFIIQKEEKKIAEENTS